MCEVQCGYQVGAKFWEVHSWLKSLRLHKYSDLFSRMTYDQMMSLTEEQLEAQGVTKGARHKIILNINKLKNRVNNLKALIQSLDEEGCNFIRQALNELKTILNTPIKPYVNSLGSTASPDSSPRCDCEDNIENSPSYQCDCFGSSSDAHELLISHIIKVIEKIGSLFIYTQYVDDEFLKMFNACIDKCLSHAVTQDIPDANLNENDHNENSGSVALQEDLLYEVDVVQYVTSTKEFVLKSKWLEKAENVYLKSWDGIKVVGNRPKGIQTKEKMRQYTDEFKRMMQRGLRVYQCPFCDYKCPPGGRSNMMNHLNGFKRKNKFCKPCKLRIIAKPAQNDIFEKLEPIDVTEIERKNFNSL